jgi:hypothetical protein
MSVDSSGNIIQKTAEAAIVTVQTYMMATQPAFNDPRAALHRSTLAGLGIMRDALAGNGAPQSNATALGRKGRSTEPLHHVKNITQGKEMLGMASPSVESIDLGKNARSAMRWMMMASCGAVCLTQRVRIMLVPKEFKLPHERQKVDGLQEPESWLADYIQIIQIVGGNKATTRSWPERCPVIPSAAGAN